MSDVLDERFRRGVRLCRDQMAFAVLRVDYPGPIPSTLEEEVKGLPPEEWGALVTGYEEELERHELGVSVARTQLQKEKQKAMD